MWERLRRLNADRDRARDALQRCEDALTLGDYDEATRALDEAQSVPGAIPQASVAYFRQLIAGKF